jgi:predicted amino acid-binding ACT domain protein
VAPKPTVKKVAYQNVMADYFSMAMKECEKEVPSADALRAEIEAYIL